MSKLVSISHHRPGGRQLWSLMPVVVLALSSFLGGFLIAQAAVSPLLAGAIVIAAFAAACASLWVWRSRPAPAMLGSDEGGQARASTDLRAVQRHPVTGLPTREHILAAMRRGDTCDGLIAVLRFVDFDRVASFDIVRAQDALAAFARRLALLVGGAKVLAQVDRDCFAIWFEDASADRGAAELRAIAYALRQELAELGSVAPSIEVGTALAPEDGTDPAELLTRAIGIRATPTVTSTGELSLPRRPSPEQERELFIIEKGLASAIEGQQLTLAFQPLIDISANRLTGAEALLRWSHPELGNVSPGRFIPVMEQIGLSDAIGMWVLNAACREARMWRESGLHGLRIAVNLSGQQLHDPTLLSKIDRTLSRHGLDGSALELELTETAAMADINFSRQIFGGLREMGIKLAIDDFGSGYSSMSYLQNLPFDKLKIDRSFVTDVHQRGDSRAICSAIMSLGRGLGLEILSEGVETEAEMRVLHQLGCHQFQGYYFAKPMPAENFRAFARTPLAIPHITSPALTQLENLEKRLSA